MKKLFKDLRIGDSLYFIYIKKSMLMSSDKYGNVYNSGKIDGEILINSIATEQDRSLIHFNPVYEYGSIKRSTLPVTFDCFNTMFLLESKIGYDDVLFFSDENECKFATREYALKAIRAEEKSITDHERSCNENISQIRERYYTVLNYKP